MICKNCGCGIKLTKNKFREDVFTHIESYSGPYCYPELGDDEHERLYTELNAANARLAILEEK